MDRTHGAKGARRRAALSTPRDFAGLHRRPERGGHGRAFI